MYVVFYSASFILFKVEMMAWKCILLVIGVSIGAVAYWLYTPLPDSYSSACSQHIQIVLASIKAVEGVVGVLSGFELCVSKAYIYIYIYIYGQQSFQIYILGVSN